MWVRFPPGVPSTEGGSGGRARPISVLLAGSTPARCTKYLSVVQWEHVGMSSTGFANGELEVVGSIPTTQTIRVVGRADMQPPFKRRDPGSTPGRPTNSTWAFGRTVMHLPLKETDVGSTPTAPTKDAPVTQLADVSGLKLESCEFESRQGYCGDGATAARKAHNLYISGFNSRPRHQAGVVQVASIRVS